MNITLNNPSVDVRTGRPPVAFNIPSSPSVIEQAEELVKWIGCAESRVSQLQCVLYQEGSSDGRERLTAAQVCLGSLVADASTRMASLCGDLASIIKRLDGRVDPL